MGDFFMFKILDISQKASLEQARCLFYNNDWRDLLYQFRLYRNDQTAKTRRAQRKNSIFFFLFLRVLCAFAVHLILDQIRL
ncbi:MAG: hypothetical protein EAZ78_00715 [Oscillatoriales cyanobacterium]|nr:MAG: hypothetical protein EA000_07405 [Oscillatoriales cyanobacterium]TAE05978.1 MAG: hypothetical protein EAZ96_03860 [Oscillatoriales cyanobacterium]TAF07096.1 MAG: hypothetical protein EAZ78_00715 [Oscillatoriales cyanobacterium]TAF69144.1 MAG: hypothetical protein EAZ59_09490 [Oscillatoriales cyanobacterium]